MTEKTLEGILRMVIISGLLKTLSTLGGLRKTFFQHIYYPHIKDKVNSGLTALCPVK